MITVNLRPGKRRKRSGVSFDFKGMLSGFRDLGNKVKDPLLLGAVGGWVLVLGFLSFVYLNNVRQLYSLEPRLEEGPPRAPPPYPGLVDLGPAAPAPGAPPAPAAPGTPAAAADSTAADT